MKKNTEQHFEEWHNFQQVVKEQQRKEMELLPADYRELLPDRGTIGFKNGEKPGGLHRFGPSYHPDRRNHSFAPVQTFAPPVKLGVKRGFIPTSNHQTSSINGILSSSHNQSTLVHKNAPTNNFYQTPHPLPINPQFEMRQLRTEMDYLRVHVLRLSEKVNEELENVQKERTSLEVQKKELALEYEECRRVRKQMVKLMSTLEAKSKSVPKNAEAEREEMEELASNLEAMSRIGEAEKVQKIWTHPYQNRKDRGELIFEIKLNHGGRSEMLQIFANDDLDLLLDHYGRDQGGKLVKQDLDSLRSVIVENAKTKVC